MSSNPTISLCMIVKNEEKFLAQCLKSAKDVVDEMIIVDTGSTDRTVEIAESFGAKVFHHPWHGSFSDARNYGLQFATCDWILQLDADEELRSDDIPAVKSAVQNREIDAVYVALMNKTPVGWTKHYSPRLFKRGRAKFAGDVHNQLVYQGKDIKTEIVIYHYGYNLSKKEMDKKFKRTEKLLRKQMSRDNTNPFTYMNLMRVLKSQHKYQEVVSLGRKSFVSAGSKMTDPILQMIEYDMICSLIELGKFPEAEKRAKNILKKFPDNLDITYSLGHSLILQKRYKEALDVYKKFLEIHEKEGKTPGFSYLIIDTYTLDHKVWAIIADCEHELGNYESGIKAAGKAVELDPDSAEYKIALARNLIKAGRKEDCKILLERMERENNVDEETYLKYFALCVKYPELGSSADVLQRAVRKYPDSEKLKSYLHSKTPAKKKKNEPTISLCMIVKNEEEFLEQCLKSVQDVVDEMIIVDTGSTDRTVEIAESFGARVFHHEWQGSFSEARNYGLQFATCDWIFQLDADEELEREDIHLVKKAVNQDKFDAVYVALLNDSVNGWSKHYFQRLFRRGKAKYEGIVHNQLICEGESAWSEIRIYHYGYNLSKEKMKKKYQRTESLLLKQIEQEKDNAFSHQNYVRILAAQKRYEDVLKAAENAFNLCKKTMNQNNRQMISFDYSVALLNLDLLDRAENVCNEILEEFPENLDITYALANVKLKKGEYKEAVSLFNKFLKILENKRKQPKYEGLIIETYSYDHRAWACLSDAYTFLSKFDDALKSAENALKINPDNYEYHVIYARALVNMGQQEKALDYLKEIDKNKRPSVAFYSKWSSLSETLPLGEKQEILDLGLKKHPDSVELNSLYAHLFESSDPEKAETIWNRVLSFDTENCNAMLHLAFLFLQEKQNNKFHDITEKFINKCTRPVYFKKLGALCIKAQDYGTAIEVLGKYLEYFPEDAGTLADVATCYVKIGQYEAALIGYKAALAFDPGNSSVILNLERLEKILSHS